MKTKVIVMKTKISVIVPVYNTEEYIGNCVESVLMQTYADFELILIDDGSSDKSWEICQAICKKDHRIRLIQQEHKGVSAARNIGMNAAEGKYLFFLDSDDVIHPQLLEGLYNLQEENHSVITSAGWNESMDDFNKKSESWKTKAEFIWKSAHLDGEKAIKYCLIRDMEISLCGIGGKMILHKAAENIRFDEDLTHSEDTWFLYQLFVNGADVSVFCRKWYYYRQHEMCSARAFSLQACRSKYKVRCNMRACEISNGRMENVKFLQWIILSDIIEWYERGRKMQDDDLMKTVEEWINAEKTFWIFIRSRWWNKLDFYLGIYCYSFYRLIHLVLNVIKSELYRG